MMKFGKDDEVSGMYPCQKSGVVHALLMPSEFQVETLEGTMTGLAGDYLMRGVEGELYPCAASVFEKSYSWV